MTLKVVQLAALLSLAAAAAVSHASQETPKELIRRYLETCLDGGELDCLDAFWVEDRVEGVRDGEALRRHLFPDLTYSVVELIAEGERVVAIFDVRGTHSREEGEEGEEAEGGDPATDAPAGSEEAAPSGRLELTEVAVYTVTNGRIASGRLFSDRMAVAQALGYTVERPRR